MKLLTVCAFRLFPAAVMLLLGSVAQAAELYKWTDAQGQVRYGDTPPSDQPYETQAIRSSDVSAPEEVNHAQAVKDAATRHPITLYSVPRCESCDLMRLFLQRNQLPFTEVDVKDDPGAQATLNELVGHLQLPFLTVGDASLDAYSRSSMRAVLEKQGYPLEPSP